MIRTLPLSQLDRTLTPWRALSHSLPSGGWLRAIRQALGMTTRQLAKSVRVTQAAVADAERTEAKGDITLATLRRYANAMDCELAYALVPRRPLEEVVKDRAEQLARDQVMRRSVLRDRIRVRSYGLLSSGRCESSSHAPFRRTRPNRFKFDGRWARCQ